jgi:hypothetical protein
MDDHIKENRLKTDNLRMGQKSHVQRLVDADFRYQPDVHNIFLIPVIFINWGIMTVVLKATEEKWLRALYGQEYEDYCKRVNRCIPFKRG